MPRQVNGNKKTSLTAVEQYELNQWLEQNHISSTNLRRSFTDVLPLARLLSRYYPELIDLNYYPPRNSVQNKLCNWESFNKRVLSRLGVHLTREQMVRVARSVPGSVDLLLFSIMRVQLEAERKAREAESSTDDDNDDEEQQSDDDQEQSKALDSGKKKKLLPHNVDDDDDDDAGSVLPPKPNMPKTLKLAKAALRRSEGPTAMTTGGIGIASGRSVATGILQRARSSVHSGSHRRLTAAGTATLGATATTEAATASVAAVGSVRGENAEKNKPQQQRMVHYSHYQQAVKQLEQKNDKIARFDQLSAHLENMLQLKCERIDELQQQVANAVQLLKPKKSTSVLSGSGTGTGTGTKVGTGTGNKTRTGTKNGTGVGTKTGTCTGSGTGTGTGTGTRAKHNNNTNKNTSRRSRPKRRTRCTATNSIEHKKSTIAIPGIGIAGADFPVELAQFH